jgi:hypothetical protein
MEMVFDDVFDDEAADPGRQFLKVFLPALQDHLVQRAKALE